MNEITEKKQEVPKHIIISRLNDIKEYINNKQYILAKLAANDLIQEMEQ